MEDKNSDGRGLWDIQKEFNDEFFATKGGWPKDSELVDRSKDFAIHLIKEATEVLDELSFKMHRAGKGAVDRDNVLEEMVDVQKFLWGWMQIWGFTWDDFSEEFKRKSMVVTQRFDQEQSFPKLVNHPCCIVDIDGVLTPYPGEYYKWLIHHFYPNYSVHEFTKLYKKMDLLTRSELKKKYRQSGHKANLPLQPGAWEFLDAVRRRSNLKIILMTNRPYEEFYRIYPDTLEWIQNRDLSFDAILWSRNKGLDALKQFKNCCWAVDDDLKNVELFREAGITTVHIQNDRDGHTTMDLAKLAEGAEKMEDLGFEWAKWQENTKSEARR